MGGHGLLVWTGAAGYVAASAPIDTPPTTSYALDPDQFFVGALALGLIVCLLGYIAVVLTRR